MHAFRTLDQAHLLQLILDNAPLGITVLTTDLRYVLVSRVVHENFMQRPREEIVGKHCYDLVGMYKDDPTRQGLERACEGCPSLRTLATGEPASSVRKVREDLVVHIYAVPLLDEKGDVVGVMEIIENIADKVVDPLTGVHNYRYYDEMMAQEGYRAQRYDSTLALLALDLNQFKMVNDRYGHIEGDTVLRRVAQTMQRTVRQTDHLCRIGGDEFAVIAPHTTFVEGEALARRIQAAIEEKFSDYGLSVAVGLAAYPKDTTDPAELREIADRRLYDLKDAPARSAEPG